MKFYSTWDKNKTYGLKEAVLSGLAPDGGLYMPEYIPAFPEGFFDGEKLSFQQAAFETAGRLFKDELSGSSIEQIVESAYDFDVPIKLLADNIYVMELFHGPTLAFKDFAARFMARLFAHLLGDEEPELTILAATSGDTGSAVAHGFYNVPGVNVVILYPGGKVSRLQEKQLTTMGGNITALEVDGTFDDCQKLVKQAFADRELRKNKRISSANSINIARLLPQTFYYVYLASHLKSDGPLAVSVPSGNFGNLTAGVIAKRMGAPIDIFIASTNANSVVPEYLKSGKFAPKASTKTVSNAMDVGDPSNFSRLTELYGDEPDRMRREIYGASFSDEQTLEAIRRVMQKYDYIMDPHGAVAYLGLVEYLESSPASTGVFLETAHPAKFGEVVKQAAGAEPPMPDRLKEYLNRQKKSLKIPADYGHLKEFLNR